MEQCCIRTNPTPVPRWPLKSSIRFEPCSSRSWSAAPASQRTSAGPLPCAGCLAPGGSTVTLQVGTGKAPAKVPNVLGMSSADARDALESAGLAARVIVKGEPPAPDSDQRAGLAWKQNPAAGAAVAQGTTATVWINPEGSVQSVPPEQETSTTG